MQANSVNLNTQNENRITAASGAIVGGVGAKCITSGKINSLAKNTLKALYQDGEKCDSFVKKHEDLLIKTSISKKGFFGKINKFLKKTDGTPEDIKKTAEDIFNTYSTKAAKKFSKAKGPKEEIAKKMEVFKDNLIKKDIKKSIKDATKHKNRMIAFGAVAAGAFLFCLGKEILLQHEVNKVIKNTENQIDEEDIKQSTEHGSYDKPENGTNESKELEPKKVKIKLKPKEEEKNNDAEIQSYIDEANNFENLGKERENE